MTYQIKNLVEKHKEKENLHFCFDISVSNQKKTKFRCRKLYHIFYFWHGLLTGDMEFLPSLFCCVILSRMTSRSRRKIWNKSNGFLFSLKRNYICCVEKKKTFILSLSNANKQTNKLKVWKWLSSLLFFFLPIWKREKKIN